MKIQNLNKYYIITDTERSLNEEELKLKSKEIKYIESEVIPKRDLMREKKTDEELLDDIRYLGKYGDYLLQRIENRSKFQRLGLKDPGMGIIKEINILGQNQSLTKAKIKKAYLQKVQIWHPDNLKKKFRY